MQEYISKKRVLAKPMTRGEYIKYRGLGNHTEEDLNEAGYLVEDLDNPKSNHPNHMNFITWSPADLHERANTEVNRELSLFERAESLVLSKHFFSAKDGVIGSHMANNDLVVPDISCELNMVTFCTLVLINGHKVVGTSFCANPDNYSRKSGEQYAEEDAMRQVIDIQVLLDREEDCV